MADGTPEELVAFCTREYPRLMGALGLYCGDRDLAEDLAQETIVKVCQHWRRVRRMASPAGWAHRVGLNLAKSHLRRVQLFQRRAAMLAVDPVHEDADVGGRVDLRRALAALPQRQRSVVVLRHYLGYSTADTALLLRIPEGTAKSLLHRALRKLERDTATREELR